MTVWTPRVIVIGAGAGGIAAGVRLLQDGITDLTVIDRAEGVGGVWRENTYPGAQCDVPSHLYSRSFHPNPDWSRRFADQPEILAYLEDAARQHGLEPCLRLRRRNRKVDLRDVWLVPAPPLAPAPIGSSRGTGG